MSEVVYESVKKELTEKKAGMLVTMREHMTSQEFEEFKAYMNVVIDRTLSKYRPSVVNGAIAP